MTRTQFFVSQLRRFAAGVLSGAIVVGIIHLVFLDSAFLFTVQSRWRNSELAHDFDGFGIYAPEFYVALLAILILVLIPIGHYLWRFARAWWVGISSLMAVVSAGLTLGVLLFGFWYPGISTVIVLVALAAITVGEYWRWNAPPNPPANDLNLNMPRQPLDPKANQRWQSVDSDDPIDNWDQDIIGRAAVVELLADHALRTRTPVLALHGELGDGKTSVLNLLRQAVRGKAIVVSFSAWLPGSERTLAIDLFADISTECRRYVHVPQLRKRAVAYARTLSASVSYLAGLREILPPQSQRDEIDELRAALGRIPLPILVLLDDIDRMQHEEILVLLKILRGAGSIPNVTFICAFSEREVRKVLRNDDLSEDYLEKFFPVTIHLSSPDPEVLGQLFRQRLLETFRQQHWFSKEESEKKFSELLEGVWNDSLSRLCTNLRKVGLLLNDIATAARPIVGEVNAFDLAVIEAIRRFYPVVYRTVRKNPLFVTYARSNWSKGRIFTEDEKKARGAEFFKGLEQTISAEKADQQAIEGMLSWIFPDYAKSKQAGTRFYGLSRPTNEEMAEREKRICDPDYFPIYFRSAVPQEMFSDAELREVLAELSSAKSDLDVQAIFNRALDAIPKGHPKRDDFLWKLGRGIEESASGVTAERLAYAAAVRASDYAYDLMNIGEAARALNIVFIVAQKLSATSAAQRVLEGVMERATDDTFAKRLLEYTQNRDRNKILTNFENVDADRLKHALIDRMIRRYGPGVDINHVDITKGDWQAFLMWADNSDADRTIQQEFWRRFVGGSRKKLAQAINFLYPRGFVWSNDPRPIIDKMFPTAEINQLLKALPQEALSEIEAKAIDRFEKLLDGKYQRGPGDPEP